MQDHNIFCRETGGRGVSGRSVLAFFLALSFCLGLSSLAVHHKSNLEKTNMERVIAEKSIKISDVISRLLYKTQALSALVIQSNGVVRDFERMAASIVDDPAILNILIAPDGVVSQVYPPGGNEKVLGYNLLGEGAGNKEAIMALHKGQLVLGGPFNLVQGGQALVGRLPVWTYWPGGARVFWGLVSVTLKYPEALREAGLDSLEREGFAYEIWRTNPDDGRRQIIAHSGYPYSGDVLFVEKHIPILNADWYFRILPVHAWYERYETWMLVAISLGMSLMFAFIVQNNCNLTVIKFELEDMVLSDPLTGLLNRKGLFREMERLIARGGHFQAHYLDLNYFKQINDVYGHSVGDHLLVRFAEGVRRHLGPGQILARISGDEFMLLEEGAPEPEGGDALWDKIEREFATPALHEQGSDILLTFSRGTAVFPDDGDNIDDLIIYADKNMYKQKREKYYAEKRRRREDFV